MMTAARQYDDELWMLSVDTSTTSMTTALSRGGEWTGELTSYAERNHSLYLVPTLQKLMAEAGIRPKELSAFAVGVGPGSYTGVRIGVTVAKTFAWTHNLALIGVSTLEAMALGGAYMTATGEQADTGETIVGQGGRLAAMDVVLQQANGQQEKTWVVPMIEARRGQAFAAVYEASPAGWRCVVPDGIRLMAAWMDDLRVQAEADKPVRIIFTGEVGLHRETIQAMANLWSGSVHTTEHGLRARFVAELGRMRWKRGDLEHVHALVPNYTQLAEAEAKLLAQGT
ncbi:tRNA (adenosine(37)-N6)-threonylcarbamoyltransferase complex dimerization subunit type 1 TsaB [Paenibacillus validus]|uniref:tRNA (Adenosine(37)-N6)-threonylcarbamoyltransferase complex dimerization subunit type 1 TsaB n=2 Tax=Paenibacillus TaxID=44249 RepID=A0A7X2ZC27_9BACL|nr:tRNA (adenosine(37)-N6)-threonylcarbamoyltransferase complex dimerization subunit type 1 TsaB [Paenibacillus validus]